VSWYRVGIQAEIGDMRVDIGVVLPAPSLEMATSSAKEVILALVIDDLITVSAKEEETKRR
jgi:hypothetical protein